MSHDVSPRHDLTDFAPPADKPALPATGRLGSIDAYRGLVMFLMMAEVLRFCAVAGAVPLHPVWRFLCLHQSHVEWTGCVLHDLIQPSFSFLVGVALPFSLASRLSRGQTAGRMAAHAVWRSLVLVFLGVFLRSVGKEQTNFTFEDTLSQIGLGYTFLFLLGLRSVRVQLAALAVILLGYWALFAAYPLPGPGFSYPAVGVPADWPHLMTGFPAHWNKNSNPAWAFDVWFLNLFPRKAPFAYNGGGYATLSFLPTLGTMILGLLAGGLLRRPMPAWAKVQMLAGIGLLLLGAGSGLEVLGACPVVKRIWTPSWVLYSGGICFLFLASFHAVIDVLGLKAWAFPLRVIGANSIAAYCLSHLVEGFIAGSLKTHLGPQVFQLLGRDYEPFVQGLAVLLVLWLILLWMDRRKINIRI
jgi:heparan-alpha-glucosaminide N-acetyltransferase